MAGGCAVDVVAVVVVVDDNGGGDNIYIYIYFRNEIIYYFNE